MSLELTLALAALASYLLGSVSFAIVVSRLRGIADPRTYGSQNPGATNVLRSGDKVAAVLTLLGDAAKGVVAVLVVRQVVTPVLPESLHLAAVALAAIAVFIGHLYPIFFRFQGGKGVATAFGALVALDLTLGFGVGLIWLVVARVTRVSSLAALTAAGAAPLITLWRYDVSVIFWAVLGISVLLIIRHKQNIAALLAGEEKAFKKKS
jgi:glycerol-3-phosphate acyltransferase PlsY